MIVPSNASWLHILFWGRGTTIKKTWLRISLVTLLSLVVTIANQHYAVVFEMNVAPFTVVGLALSIFLGFRNNTSYDRFWEGRKLWGALVNTARSGARQVLTLIDASHTGMRDRQRSLVYGLMGYVHALRLSLREDRDLRPLDPFLPRQLCERLTTEQNTPVAILLWLGHELRECYVAGAIHPQHLPLLEGTLEKLTDVQGGCERIKATPIPFPYTVLMHRVVAFYCFGLPFALVGTAGTFTPAVAAFVAYVFFGLDMLGEEIEDPFGTDPADLPLSAISHMIEINLRQALGETDVPELLRPVDDVLN